MAAPLARKGELGVIAGALALVLLIVLSPSSGVSFFPDPVTSVSQPRPMPTIDGGGFFGMNRFYGGIREFRVEVEPEFMRSMEAGLPTEHCSKVRFKKVPLKRLTIDGNEIQGKSWMRFRGFCSDHWNTKQRSVKINLQGQAFQGHNTFNLNALAVDPTLFDIWATGLLHRAGGIAPRMSLARFYINGKYNGVRELLQNIDGDMLVDQGLPRGEIYREITWAFMGHAPNLPFETSFRRYADVNELKEFWKKNTRKGRSWDHFLDFQNAIFDSVIHGRESWRDVTNRDHYINYLAVVAITGTQHLNNHNIPVYIPAGTTRAVPIGYDFGLSYASTLGIKNPVDEHFQPLVLTQNWLGSLFWSDREMRALLHARIIEILKTLKPAESYAAILERGRQIFGEDINQGLYLEAFGSNDRWAKAISDAAKVRQRIDFLQEKYLRPTAQINAQWEGAASFQFLIDGLGMYDVTLAVPDQVCARDADAQVTAEINGAAAVPVVECVDGRLRARTVLAERIETERAKIGLGRSMPQRTTVGGVLITVNNPDRVPIRSIDITPRHGGSTFRPTGNWPFFFQRSGEGRMSLNAGSSVPTPPVDLVTLVPPEKLAAHLEGSEVVVDTYRVDPQIQFDDFGPVLCWTAAGAKRRCFELAEQFLFSDGVRKERLAALTSTPGTLPQSLAQKDIEDCKEFNFTPGIWVIKQPIVFEASCQVRFFPSANLEFVEGAFLILKGKTYFPESGSAEFRPYRGATWGGVVLSRQAEAHVQYATFRGGNEFVWNGRRFTGTLNLIDVANSSIYRSSFFDNKGDDGLNVRGGKTRIHQNRFARNRDALDVDLGTAVVENNLIEDSKDDGLDLGSAQDVLIRNNIIARSGDKGISVGEGSKIDAYYNLLAGNNIGVANKDGSKALLIDNYFGDNMVGVMAYNKVTEKTLVGGISGRSFFGANGTRSRIIGPAESGMHLVEQESQTTEAEFIGKMLPACEPCRSYLQPVPAN